MKIILMLLNRDRVSASSGTSSKEPQRLITYILKKLKDGGLIGSSYRSNYKIYKINEVIAPVIPKITRTGIE